MFEQAHRRVNDRYIRWVREAGQFPAQNTHPVLEQLLVVAASLSP
jgi:hypothetical protein